jgi:hypothetical protein
VDAGCTPSGILPAHLADQISDLARNVRSSGLDVPHLPGPEQTRAGTMPGYDRFWLDDGQGGAPVKPKARQTDPQQAVPRAQFRAFPCGPLKYADLVAQSQVFRPEGSTRTEDRGQSCQECRERNGRRRELCSDISRFSGGTGLAYKSCCGKSEAQIGACRRLRVHHGPLGNNPLPLRLLVPKLTKYQRCRQCGFLPRRWYNP